MSCENHVSHELRKTVFSFMSMISPANPGCSFVGKEVGEFSHHMKEHCILSFFANIQNQYIWRYITRNALTYRFLESVLVIFHHCNTDMLLSTKHPQIKFVVCFWLFVVPKKTSQHPPVLHFTPILKHLCLFSKKTKPFD